MFLKNNWNCFLYPSNCCFQCVHSLHIVNSGTKLILNQKGMIPHSQGSFKGCVN